MKPVGINNFGPPPAVTTWNPADKSTYVTLSNGNLTAQKNTNNRFVGCRGTTYKSVGKLYFEARQNDTYSSNNHTFVGVAETGFILDDGSTQCYPGVDFYGVSCLSLDGTVIRNATVQLTADTWSNAGDYIGVAVDLVNLKIWWKRVAGYPGPGKWNGNASADPATNSGGLQLTAGPFAPACAPFGVSPALSSVTLNCGQVPFAAAPPAGFIQWG